MNLEPINQVICLALFELFLLKQRHTFEYKKSAMEDLHMGVLFLEMHLI